MPIVRMIKRIKINKMMLICNLEMIHWFIKSIRSKNNSLYSMNGIPSVSVATRYQEYSQFENIGNSLQRSSNILTYQHKKYVIIN